MPKLVLKFKDAVRMEYPLDGPITAIGRTPNNDICIDNLAVSRNHAQIVREQERFVIEDLDSNNGTFVNGNRIHRHILNDNDSILIGKHTLQFLSGAVEPTARPPSPISASPVGGMDLNKTYILNPAAMQEETQPGAPRPGLSSSQRLASTSRLEVGSLTATLSLLEGDLPQKRIELIQPATTFGKGREVSIRLAGFLTPALVTVIHRKADGYTITAMAGGSKTRVNGEKVDEPRKLIHGDVIDICGYRFAFTLPDG